MNDMQHEACDAHCDDCGDCLGRDAQMISVGLSGARYRDVPYTITAAGNTYCHDCLPEAWRPDPADGYAPGPEIAGTYGDVTLTVQRTHLHPDTAAYYWRIMLEGHHAPAADGTVVALDPTMTTRSVALALAWNLYASEAARAIAGDSPILIHHTPATHYGLDQYTDEIHEIHMEMS